MKKIFESQSVRNMIWSFSQQFSLKIVAFFVQIVLARILMPEDFGIIALITIFINIGYSLADGGMRSSLIRSVNADQKDFSTVFYINIVISCVFYIILFITAPLISQFYNIDQLTMLIRVLSLSFIFKSLNIVQSTILVKQLKFRKLFLIQLPANLLSAIIGLVAAYSGLGVWSLVIMTISESLISTLIFWITSNWKPSYIFDKQIFQYHFNFGYKLTIASVMNTTFQNIYTIIIGKFYSPSIVGFYNRAESFNSFPVRMSISSIKAVTYPMLSKYGADNVKLKYNYRLIMLQVVFWITPVLLIMYLNAENLFILILTQKWMKAVVFFKILCIASIFYPLQEYNLQILDIKGKSGTYLKIEFLKKFVTVAVIAVFINLSIQHLVMSQIFLNIIFFIIGAIVSGKLLNYSLADQLKDVSKIYIVNLIVFSLLTLSGKYFQFTNKLSEIFFITSSFMFLYILFSKILKIEPFMFVYNRIKKK